MNIKKYATPLLAIACLLVALIIGLTTTHKVEAQSVDSQTLTTPAESSKKVVINENNTTIVYQGTNVFTPVASIIVTNKIAGVGTNAYTFKNGILVGVATGQ